MAITKTIVFGLLTVILLASASGCRKTEQKENNASEDGNAVVETTLDMESGSPDYDANGNLILFSTKERPVIKTTFGYYIFQFDGDTLIRLQIVYDKETVEAAQELYNTMMEPGYDQKDFLSIGLSDQYVVCTASENSARYGYIFKMKKTNILNSFYNKQNAES